MELLEDMAARSPEKTLGTLELKHSEEKCISLQRPWRACPRGPYQEKMGADCTIGPATQREKAAAWVCKSAPTGRGGDQHEVYDRCIESVLIQPTFVTRLPAFSCPWQNAVWTPRSWSTSMS